MVVEALPGDVEHRVRFRSTQSQRVVLRGLTVRNAVSVVAQLCRLNVIVHPSVEGRVDTYLEDDQWREALTRIAEQAGSCYEEFEWPRLVPQ
jgi:hypothetical protein